MFYDNHGELACCALVRADDPETSYECNFLALIFAAPQPSFPLNIRSEDRVLETVEESIEVNHWVSCLCPGWRGQRVMGESSHVVYQISGSIEVPAWW